MSKKTPLQHIIEIVLKEKKIPADDSNVQTMRRRFYTLLESIGGNKEELKAGGRKLEFDELELPFMKVIIGQVCDGEGLIANLLDEKSDVSSIDIRNLIQSMIDEESKNGASEDELIQLALFMQKLFNCWQLYSLENCHSIINALYSNMTEMSAELQTFYMGKVEHILKKEYKLRMVEMAYGVLDISRIIELSKQESGDETGIQSYIEYDPEIRNEYIQRDKRVLKAIQDDDDLRNYIEKKIGKKARLLKKFVFLVNILFNRHRVGLTFGAIFIAAVALFSGGYGCRRNNPLVAHRNMRFVAEKRRIRRSNIFSSVSLNLRNFVTLLESITSSSGRNPRKYLYDISYMQCSTKSRSDRLYIAFISVFA